MSPTSFVARVLPSWSFRSHLPRSLAKSAFTLSSLSTFAFTPGSFWALEAWAIARTAARTGAVIRSIGLMELSFRGFWGRGPPPAGDAREHRSLTERPMPQESQESLYRLPVFLMSGAFTFCGIVVSHWDLITGPWSPDGES